VLIAVLAGCGGNGGSTAESLPDTLGYVPRDAHLVMLVPTDLEGDQWQRFGRLVAPELTGTEFDTVRKNIAASIPDVDFDDELAPLLGDTLVVATFGLPKSPRVLAILHTPDAEMAKRVAEGIRNGGAVADGRTLVVELDGGNYELDAAVDRHEAGSGMDAETFARRFGDGADDDALVRVLSDGAELPGIKSAALAFALDDDAIKLHVRAHADDPRGLEQFLAGLGHGGLHPLPGTRASVGFVGDRLVVDDDAPGQGSVHLAPLGEGTSDIETSGDLVEGDVTIPAPDGLGG
jgi:hypothetical protein